jgi:hypothetical protein
VAAIVVMELLPTGGLLLPSSTQPPVGSKERARGLPVPLIGQLSNRQLGGRWDDLLTRGGPEHCRDLGSGGPAWV